MDLYLEKDVGKDSRESMSGDEEDGHLIQDHTPEGERQDLVQPGKKSKIVAHLRLIIFVLLLSNVLLLAATSTLLISRLESPKPKKGHPPVTWLPPEKQQHEAFHFQPDFGKAISPEVEESWRKLIPSKIRYSDPSGSPDFVSADNCHRGQRICLHQKQDDSA